MFTNHTFEHIVEIIFIIAVLEALWVDTQKYADNFGFHMIKKNRLVSLVKVLNHLFYALQGGVIVCICSKNCTISVKLNYLCSCKVSGLDVFALDDNGQIAVTLFNPGFEYQRSHILNRWKRQTSVGRHQQVF